MPAMMLLWGVALVLATAATTYVLHRKLTHGRGPEPDGLFWDVFGGLVVVTPAIIVPAVHWAPAGLIMVFVGVATAAGTLLGIRKVERIHAAEPRRRAGFLDDAARHRNLMEQWQRYELDPARTIDFPAMTDVRTAETAALTRAMREAEYCRVTAGTDYRAAVERLADALREAERAAGVPTPTPS
ncbi:hypothetical protein [Paenarthrobacter aurescens]|uniref:Uncharacterized protein n=1 Tax=Paenarthrobacter aurescens TaxID=43663 RepID=A0A4Y3N9J9_PAEAU|nr:hypothetical protein [Paenarthrobacter aurescens]MDO6141735.1 hypothetical protein [Paenarthrobacter aurescens]MDO6149498.1 hypothetical protein [Paenarthrobacter aurescens]MDO6156784.1 hypothetical protein [Paenarthrobacter aurescens]MDO6160770.1 hypothetical protein [Paenarthrobacter aurescens]GEB18614.1 hypothetical protein AAU01_13690 [Paenarthrobacter aurescens]